MIGTWAAGFFWTYSEQPLDSFETFRALTAGHSMTEPASKLVSGDTATFPPGLQNAFLFAAFNALSFQVKEVLTEFKSLKATTSENTVKTPQNIPNKSSNTSINNKGKQTNVQNKSAQNKWPWNEANLSSSSDSSSSPTSSDNKSIHDFGSKLDKIVNSLEAVTRRMDQMDDIAGTYGTFESINLEQNDDDMEGFF